MPSALIPSATRTAPFRANPYSSASHLCCHGFDLGTGVEGSCFALHQAQDLWLSHLTVLHPVLTLFCESALPFSARVAHLPALLAASPLMSLHFLTLLVMQPSLAQSEPSLWPSLCRKLRCHSPKAKPGLLPACSHPREQVAARQRHERMGHAPRAPPSVLWVFVGKGASRTFFLLENKGWVCISFPTGQSLGIVFSYWLLRKAGKAELFVQQQENCPNKINLLAIPARAGPELHHRAVVSSSRASRPSCWL